MKPPAARSVRPITKTEAIGHLLGIHCASCGAVLGAPGTPCDRCGKIPDVSAPEAEAALDSAAAIALVQQQVLEAEAEALFRQAVSRWQDAAQVVLVARLTDARDAAQKAVDEHQARHDELVTAVTEAERAEDAAAADLQPWAQARAKRERAVKLARKMKRGPDAVTDAVRREEIAAEECRPWQDALASRGGDREKAERLVTASQARLDQLTKALQDTKAALNSPGTAPMGRNAIVAAPFLMLAEERLDDGGIDLAAEIGRGICDMTGRTEEITAEARRELLEEYETRVKGGPLIVGRGPGGQRTAMANPLSTGNPQPWQAASPVPPGGVVTPAPPVPATAQGFGA